MDFLYRMHLVEFDPKDEKAITKNWEWIKKAIQLSSEPLSHQIRNTDFPRLPAHVKNKIYKYLLRGRYRSTPFGLWAGVGTGRWQAGNALQEIELDYSEIDSCIATEADNNPDFLSETYRLAPGVQQLDYHIKYQNYSQKDQGWRICHLERNKIVDLIVYMYSGDKTFDYIDFQAFFKNKSSVHVKRIWQMIIDAGLVIPAFFPWEKAKFIALPFTSTDIKLTIQLTLNPSVKAQLDFLANEMGSLFVPIKSGYLQNFKSWFLKKYDDRFVPMTLLSNDLDSIEIKNSENDPDTNPAYSGSGKFWSDDLELDLSRLFEKKPSKLPSHILFAFKVGAKNQIYIENIVCNRPFAYSGRFSLDPEIEQITAKSVKTQMTDENVSYADLFIFDSDKCNYITRHKNMCSCLIYPYGPSVDKHVIGVDELWLGIRNDHVILYSDGLKKTVIPVIQHPLNPSQITHQLTRLIWEIGTQNQMKFLPYYHPAFQESSYLPRLKWDNILIQGRRWLLSIDKFESIRELYIFLDESKIPNEVLAGHLDRELLLDWTHPTDLNLLWEELKILKQIQLLECLWKNDSVIYSKNGNALYPQFIHSWSQKPEKQPNPGFLNRITQENKKWVYARIFTKHDGYAPFFLCCLPILIKSILEEFSVKKWYFLNYHSPEPEIRIRFELSQTDIKTDLETKVSSFSFSSGWIEEVRFCAYFPETEKYGIQGIPNAESIFHWESELILFGRNNQVPSLKTLSETQRLQIIVPLITAAILHASINSAVFDYLKSFIKEIPHRLKKETVRISNQELKAQKLPMEYAELFVPYDLRSDEGSILLLFNHIHMFCNRVFPEDTKVHESKLLYLLYKAMGKELFSDQRIDSFS